MGKFSEYTEIDKKYHPIWGDKSFKLPTILISKEKIILLKANPKKEFLKIYNQTKIPFRIHPDFFSQSEDNLLNRMKKIGELEYISVVPTSSTRTVMTLNEKANHYIKLHFPKRISKFIRRLKTDSIKHSLDVSRDLKNIKGSNFSYLPESIGVIYGGEKGWGFICREKTPPVAKKFSRLIPFFSLYSKDVNVPQDPPILIQLARGSYLNPKKFLLKKVLKPFIESWCEIARERGILLQAHSQNCLYEIGSSLRSVRIIHKDFQSSMIDPLVRKKRGLNNEFTKHVIGIDASFLRKKEYSITYDYLVTELLLKPLVRVYNKYFRVDKNNIQEQCKEIFRKSFPDYHHFFPKTTYSLVDEILPNNEVAIKNNHLVPRWRP